MSPLRNLAATTLLVLAVASPAFAQSTAEKEKKKLARLFTDALAGAADSTVQVQVDGKDAVLGTIVSADGYVVTKGSELLKGGELRGVISVQLRDGTAYDAKTTGYDKATDLALLRIDADGLKPVKFAGAKAAEVGNWVAAAGPKSDPVAVGVVSAPARKLYQEEALIDNANKGFLGITMDTAKDETGVVVTSIAPGAAAAKGGIKRLDLIFEVGGKAVTSPDTLRDALDPYKPGETIKVKIKRGEEEKELSVKLGNRGDIDRGSFQNSMGSSLSGRRTGFPLVIQHDTVIRPTDCGGPLVDLDGRVLGINIARAGRVETWALPGSVVEAAVKDMKAGKFPISAK